MNMLRAWPPSGRALLSLSAGAWLLGLVALLTLALGWPLFFQVGRDLFMKPHLIAGTLTALFASGLAVIVCVVSAALAFEARWPRHFAVPFGLCLCYLVLSGVLVARAI